MMITPRARVEAALRGQWGDYVPFTTYENKIFYSQVERELRNAGLCILEYRVPVFLQEDPGITEKSVRYRGADGLVRVRDIVQTPAGEITQQLKHIPEDPRVPRQLLPWHEEYYFKGPADYAPLAAMVRQRRYVANDGPAQRASEQAGGDLFYMATIGYSPLQEIIYHLMGVEQFAIEWAERRDEVLKLYAALTEDRRKIYPIVADAPVLAVNYCGNVSSQIMGPARFQQYVLPHYNELAELLHTRGKLLGIQFDDNMRALAPAVASSQIDYVEAFTPWPNGDMTVGEARAAWPDKVLWINFPSSIHLEPPSVIEETARQILQEAAPGDRFLIGATELVPVDRWQISFQAISRAIQTHGRLPIG